MKSLVGSKTAENLMKAFVGESQARNRYTFYAKAANKEKFIEASNLFNEVADQESQHAKIFFRYLVRDFDGAQLTVNADYPVALSDSTLANLKSAAIGENEEWTALYPEFAKVAREEGYDDVAKSFEEITVAEKFHEARFLHIYNNIQNGEVFKRPNEVQWKCSNCGYVHTSTDAPSICPACVHPQGYFEVFSLN